MVLEEETGQRLSIASGHRRKSVPFTGARPVTPGGGQFNHDRRMNGGLERNRRICGPCLRRPALPGPGRQPRPVRAPGRHPAHQRDRQPGGGLQPGLRRPVRPDHRRAGRSEDARRHEQAAPARAHALPAHALSGCRLPAVQPAHHLFLAEVPRARFCRGRPPPERRPGLRLFPG